MNAAEIRAAYENKEISEAEYWNRLAALQERAPKKHDIVLTEPPSRVYYPLNQAERDAVSALQNVSFGISNGARRFAHQIKDADQLTARQREYLRGLVLKFRRQLFGKDADHKAAALVERMTK